MHGFLRNISVLRVASEGVGTIAYIPRIMTGWSETGFVHKHSYLFLDHHPAVILLPSRAHSSGSASAYMLSTLHGITKQMVLVPVASEARAVNSCFDSRFYVFRDRLICVSGIVGTEVAFCSELESPIAKEEFVMLTKHV